MNQYAEELVMIKVECGPEKRQQVSSIAVYSEPIL